MAPPGILSLDEHFDVVGTTCLQNFTIPAFSSQSKRSAPLVRGVTTSVFHDHDYVLHQPQSLFGDSSTDANSYEEIGIASLDFDDFVSKSSPQKDDATDVIDSNYGDENKARQVASSEKPVDNSPMCHILGSNDAHLMENTHNDKTTPMHWFMDDSDDDFLDDLDKFDLAMDEFDPCIDMDTEDSFQHFIEETLNGSTTTNPCMDEEFQTRQVSSEDEEDEQKKEYFFQLLGLQSVHATQSSSMCQRSYATNTTNPHNTFIQGQSLEVDVETNTNSSNPSLVASAISTHGSSLSASVPAKMCSCTATDWKDSVLYSTAPVYPNGLVQTNLTTAPTKSTLCNRVAHNLHFTSATDSGNLPSMESISKFEELTPCSLLAGAGLQLKNPSDADLFLRWLEEENGENTISSTQNSSAFSEGSIHTSFTNISTLPKVDTTNNCDPESSRLSARGSISDMDSFIDLETYAMERSPSGKDIHSVNHLDANFDSLENLGCIDSKCSSTSELRFRLSLLDDHSCRSSDRYLEKRDASNQFDVLADHDASQSSKSHALDDHLADLTSDAASSPLSPYSSSSVHSSYGQTKGAEDSLDLLGLFSEENSFLLMEQSDGRYGFC